MSHGGIRAALGEGDPNVESSVQHAIADTLRDREHHGGIRLTRGAHITVAVA